MSDTRAAILDAALTVVVKEGYDGLTTQAVAERADLTDAGVHYHFETRADLLAGVGERLEAQTERLLSEFDGPPGDRLAAFLREQFALLADVRDWTPASLQLRAAAASGNDRLAAALDGIETATRAFLTDTVREGVETGAFTDVSPEQTTALIHAALDAAEMRADRGDEVTDVASGLREHVLSDLYVQDPPLLVGRD